MHFFFFGYDIEKIICNIIIYIGSSWIVHFFCIIVVCATRLIAFNSFEEVNKNHDKNIFKNYSYFDCRNEKGVFSVRQQHIWGGEKYSLYFYISFRHY